MFGLQEGKVSYFMRYCRKSDNLMQALVYKMYLAFTNMLLHRGQESLELELEDRSLISKVSCTTSLI